MHTLPRPFPYEYGTDLHWLWGWGAAIELWLKGEHAPHEYLTEPWNIHLPDRQASDALTRYSKEFPFIVRQIEKALGVVKGQYALLQGELNDLNAWNLAQAMDVLAHRILVGAQTIADHHRAVEQLGERDSNAKLTDGEFDSLRQYLNAASPIPNPPGADSLEQKLGLETHDRYQERRERRNRLKNLLVYNEQIRKKPPHSFVESNAGNDDEVGSREPAAQAAMPPAPDGDGGAAAASEGRAGTQKARRRVETNGNVDHTVGRARGIDGETEKPMPPALTKNEALVLHTMANFDPTRLLFVEEIIEAMPEAERLSDKTVRGIINRLIELDLAERPEGDKGGARLKNRGRHLATKIPL